MPGFQTEAESDIEFQPPDDKPLPDADLIDDEQSRVIARAIATLPEKYRDPALSKLECEVTAERANVINFDLD